MLKVFKRNKWEVSACNLWGTPRIEDFYVAESEEEAEAYVVMIKKVTEKFRKEWRGRTTKTD